MKKLASTFWVLLLVVGLLPLSGVAALATSHTSQAPQGDWVGAVGGDGYVLAGWNSTSDEVSLPGATLDVVTGTGYRWVSSTTDVRALEAPDESFRRAAAWYDATAVEATLTFTDAYAGDLSVYMLDWNAGGRRQTVTVDDGDGTPVETVIAEDFSGGAWITVPVNVAATGTVTVTATRTAGSNAVVSGLFLGGAPVVEPDTVPAAPAAPTTTVVSYAQVDLDWVAPDDGGSEITTYHVWRGVSTGALAKIGTSTTTSYTDTTVEPDTSYLYAVSAENAVGEGAVSPETAAVTPAKGFVQAPQGDWVGAVGGDGYVLAGWNSTSDEVSLPGATLDVVTGARFRWVSSTTDVRALEAPDESFRRAATWYDKTQVQATLTFTDAYAGDLSVYMLDWDASGRRQTVTVDDGDGTPVETVIAEDFSGGAWITVPVNVAATGTVTITAVNDNPVRNAVVSGLFLGGAPVVEPDTVPAAPAAPTTTVVSYAQVDLDWVAPDDGGSEITTYHVWRGVSTGALVKIGTSTTLDYTDTTVEPDTSYLYAVSAENAVGEGAVSPETAAVTPAKGFVQAPQGDWVGAVGGDGYVLAGWNSTSDEVSLPGATLDVVTGARFRWVSSTTDVRALEAPDESFRRAATWYDKTQVQATLTFTDAYAGDLSVYMLDWDAGGRRQTVTVDDGDGTPVETVIAEDFSGGAWITVPVNVAATGTVTITAVNDNPVRNAVVSGLFLGGAPVVEPDTVPAAPAAPTTTVVSYAQVDLDWVAPDDGGSEITTYHVWRGVSTGALVKIGTSTTTSYTDTTVEPDTSYLYAVSAENAVGEGAVSPETAAVTPAKGFVQAPQGDWVGAVGGDGYVLAGWNSTSDEVSLPGATLDVVTGARFRWVSSTTDVRALEAPDESFRRAATWYDATAVEATLTFTDAYAGDLSVYMLDWNAGGRRQTVTVDDGDGTPVETVIAEDFSGGAWITVPVNVAATGTVTVTATRTAGSNAVVSGLFLGGAPVVEPDTVPAAPAAPTTTVVSYAQVDLDWVAPDDGGSEITTYHVWRGVSTGALAKIGTSTTTSYTDTTVEPDTSYLYAVSAENAVGEGAVSPETAAVTPAKGFVQAPQGDWVGAVGGDGYVLAGWNSGSDEVSLPGATLDVVTGARFRWVSSTTDVRALEAPDESFRRAATWYDGTAVEATLTFTDAYAGDLSVYMLDYNAGGRRQTVTVDDGDGTPVETVIAEDFSGGAWITVPVNVAATGTVTITATRTAGANAVVSGLFLGGAPVIEPLSAPTGLQATPGDNSVTLTWEAPTSTGGEDITGYQVYRGTTSGSLTPLDGTATTSFVDSTALGGTTYFYAVAAVTATTEGPQSEEASATPTTP